VFDALLKECRGLGGEGRHNMLSRPEGSNAKILLRITSALHGDRTQVYAVCAAGVQHTLRLEIDDIHQFIFVMTGV
jgi:hypothetical protein